jgi:hypothetical protein
MRSMVERDFPLRACPPKALSTTASRRSPSPNGGGFKDSDLTQTRDMARPRNILRKT